MNQPGVFRVQLPSFNRRPGMARTSPTTDPTSEAVENLRDRAHEQVDRAGSRRNASPVREMGDLVQQFRPAVERFLKEQPIRTLADATVVGFLLGALWKR